MLRVGGGYHALAVVTVSFSVFLDESVFMCVLYVYERGCKRVCVCCMRQRVDVCSAGTLPSTSHQVTHACVLNLLIYGALSYMSEPQDVVCSVWIYASCSECHRI